IKPVRARAAATLFACGAQCDGLADGHATAHRRLPVAPTAGAADAAGAAIETGDARALALGGARLLRVAGPARGLTKQPDQSSRAAPAGNGFTARPERS